MNYKKRILVILPVAILLCLAIWAIYEYSKPHSSAGNKATDVQIDAISLYNDFAKNETAANAKYLDKIIEVNGAVDDIENSNGALIVILNANQITGGISCRMFESKTILLKRETRLL